MILINYAASSSCLALLQRSRACATHNYLVLATNRFIAVWNAKNHCIILHLSFLKTERHIDVGLKISGVNMVFLGVIYAHMCVLGNTAHAPHLCTSLMHITHAPFLSTSLTYLTHSGHSLFTAQYLYLRLSLQKTGNCAHVLCCNSTGLPVCCYVQIQELVQDI